ncbi:MAG: ABC transporter ATP-binding protein [Aminivibrio sp.]|uniref:ABC transporter ATP-binding protein n=1 Tax=Aminivibrio sp. TaxID=1872489 RepID=UPI002B209B0B|nr:ABC transporter ATP-binding protein [Aminivibrio sp.]MDD3514743.1 ABC transporter ATP-binding protein [Synergistaceae bacterium]MEA4951551.1 ABC transporter ATP-binding protein [Aminivibrio sp.]
MTDAVNVSGLKKRFGEVEAVAGISFSVHQGELFGFLGPNGAGKTTTINMLTGLARPDSGTFSIGGIDCLENPRGAQHLIGVVPDESNLYPELSGFDNLCFCGALYGMRKADREARARGLLNSFGLAGAGGRKFGGYSKGMKRKLTIAAGIMHSPGILFLDEPTTGIDVASARQVRSLIQELHDSGTTIFLTTHYIEEAERLCGRIAFIVSGRIVKTDTVENLLQPVRNRHVVHLTCESLPDTVREGLASSFPALAFTLPEKYMIRAEADSPVPVGPVVRFLEEAGAVVLEARRIRPSLEDVFVEITGIEAHAMESEKRNGGGR